MIALVVLLPLLSSDVGDLDRRATEAYRAREYATAAALWEDALEGAEGPGERARLLYNLGNGSYRRERYLEAVGWYTAALRVTPRDGAAWENLELARSKAELVPADRGDLASTLQRLLSSLTLAEAQWLLLAALLGWAVCLGGEALRGSRAWRRAALLGLLTVCVCAGPLAWHGLQGEGRPLMVQQAGGATGRSEPRPDAASLARLDPGETVRLQDELPGWVAVEADGRRVWVRESALFELSR